VAEPKFEISSVMESDALFVTTPFELPVSDGCDATHSDAMKRAGTASDVSRI
jgi:hypothetical protein